MKDGVLLEIRYGWYKEIVCRNKAKDSCNGKIVEFEGRKYKLEEII